jgi:hypothetical protein
MQDKEQSWRREAEPESDSRSARDCEPGHSHNEVNVPVSCLSRSVVPFKPGYRVVLLSLALRMALFVDPVVEAFAVAVQMRQCSRRGTSTTYRAISMA